MILKENALTPFAGQTSKDLIGFLDEILAEPDRLLLKPPVDGIYQRDGGTAVTLLRRPPFQLEMIIFGPNATVPMHAHPDVESVEIGFSGNLELFVANSQVVFFRDPRHDGTSRFLWRFVLVPAGVMHGGRTGSEGAVFLSAQRWLNGVSPRPIATNWLEES